jgi:hypothetical protein
MFDIEMLCLIYKIVFQLVTEVFFNFNIFLAVWRILHLRRELFYLKYNLKIKLYIVLSCSVESLIGVFNIFSL